MKKILSLLLVSVLLIGCSSKTTVDQNQKETITVTHDYGTVEVPVNPKKAVVFDMGALDAIDALGIDVELSVPISNLTTNPSKYSNSHNAGSIKEPDFEKLYEFNPDVIIISGRQAESYDQLNKIAPTIFVGEDYSSKLEDFKHNTTVIGEIFGVKEKAISLADEVISKINEVGELGKQYNGKSLVILLNNGNISAYGTGSRFGIIHDYFNIPSVDSTIESSTHGQSIGFEYIAEKNPDLIFVVDRTSVVAGDQGSNNALDNALIKSTNAYKNNNIVYLNAENWYIAGSGINTLKLMADEIKVAISK